MTHTLVLHEDAAVELEAIYDYIADQAGPDVAWNYVQGVRMFLSRLAEFPERGTVRQGKAAGLRVIGYRRRLSIAFVVKVDVVVIVGFFYAGRNLDEAVLQGRQAP